jgi:hypothetical protein
VVLESHGAGCRYVVGARVLSSSHRILMFDLTTDVSTDVDRRPILTLIVASIGCTPPDTNVFRCHIRGLIVALYLCWLLPVISVDRCHTRPSIAVTCVG